jgi:hypothetical protein
MFGPLTEEMLPGLPRSGEARMPKDKSVPDLAVIWRGALRSDRPKHRRASLRASVSSDRSIQEVTSRLDASWLVVTLDP